MVYDVAVLLAHGSGSARKLILFGVWYKPPFHEEDIQGYMTTARKYLSSST
jgi:hypothetical protein